MKNLSKCIGISLLCTVFFLGYSTKASTGDVVTTGSTTTGIVIPYTGSLLSYLNAQENSLSSGFTNTYTRLYSIFSKTGLNILKSIEYQSLVCFGAIKNESLLSQLQKDKMDLTISFKKDFIELENQVLALEEKKSLQESDGLNVFASGTNYESEKARLKEIIDSKAKLHRGFITNFETSYITKNINFLTTFQQYRDANKDLIKGIQDKMTRVQGILTAFSGVTSTVDKINAKVTGLDDLIKKMEDTKIKGLENLDKTLQQTIDINSKKYKKLQNLPNELTTQKAYVLNQYQIDFDEYFSNNFQNRYNRTQYLALKKQVDTFRSKFYTNTNQLNCLNVLASSDEGTALFNKIYAMQATVNSGLLKIETEGISTTFKDQLFSGFQSLYIQKFKQRYTEYGNFTKEYIKLALKNIVSSITPTVTSNTSTVSLPTPMTKYVFTKPFKSNEYHEGIKALQNLFTTLDLYTGAIDGIYNAATKKAVYTFQLSKGLLKGYENKPEVRGWMGPATRNALNTLTK
ncbi:MAG TPA: peptidoglycan-binding domain-containing protein [Candidatus Absconditabacterales bacterium]|nr:peptidoglycan-binding domain-containing protein [Candidatus Absconditabacterales bacterium]